jgi:hypothetical protein
MSNFSPAGTGGLIGSKIDEQDGVAVRLVLEVIAEMVEIGVEPSTIGSTNISCEVGDDLLIFDDKHLRLVSVKNTAINPKGVVEESKRLGERLASLATREVMTRELCIVGSIPPETAQLAASLDDLHNVLRSAVDHKKTIADWQSANKVVTRRATKSRDGKPGKAEVAVNVIDPESFVVRSFSHRMDAEQTRADFARSVRKLVPLADFSDKRVDSLYRDMIATLAEARRTRGTVSISEFTRLLQAVTLPFRVQAVLSTHVRTKFGYSVAPQTAESLAEDSALVDRASNRARKRMRRAMSAGLIADLLRGPVRCIECGHPLMANMLGYGAGGIACSRCGFAPYMSILYACECGEPCLVVAQPSTVQAELMIAVQLASTGKCPSCSKPFDAERFSQRTFVLPLPWPPEDFTHQDLIDVREKAGLSQPKRNAKGRVVGYTASALGKAAIHEQAEDVADSK